jgi:thiamine biosynthesis lipoprotein
VGVQHPTERTAVLGTLAVAEGAVATSGAYERGAHIRLRPGASLISVTVVGPELGEADGLATAVFASGHSPPGWWEAVPPSYGLLTVAHDARVRWIPPREGDRFAWSFPPGAAVMPSS